MVRSDRVHPHDNFFIPALAVRALVAEHVLRKPSNNEDDTTSGYFLPPGQTLFISLTRVGLVQPLPQFNTDQALCHVTLDMADSLGKRYRQVGL